MKILATGDLHLGRRPARLPEEALDDPRLGTDAAWRELVELAVERGVDVVALTGDVVERDNRFFEALGPLERGLRRLAEAGIDAVAVAGNHDFDVLDHLADQIASPRFHLLGRGGRWERLRLVRPGGEGVLFDGWSFPDRHAADPLPSYDLGVPDDLPAVGLLHCEVGVPQSPYAPTAAARLRARPLALWLLGHVHAPGPVPGEGIPLLYPGSLQALGLGEPGIHGPWLVELRGRRVERLEQIPLSRLRYEDVEVEVGGAEGRPDLEGRAASALRHRLTAAEAQGGGHLRCLVARLVLVGRGRVGAHLPEFGRGARALRLTVGEASAAVAEVVDRTRPPYDLARLAEAHDPPGVLACLLLRLAGGHEGRELLGEAVASLRGVHDATSYTRLAGVDPAPEEDDARALLLRAGYRLLESLLDQKAAPAAETP